jgi:hypothetical protein
MWKAFNQIILQQAGMSRHPAGVKTAEESPETASDHLSLRGQACDAPKWTHSPARKLLCIVMAVSV